MAEVRKVCSASFWVVLAASSFSLADPPGSSLWSEDFSQPNGAPKGWVVLHQKVLVVNEALNFTPPNPPDPNPFVEPHAYVGVDKKGLPFEHFDSISVDVSFPGTVGGIGDTGGILFCSQTVEDRWHVNGYSLDYLEGNWRFDVVVNGEHTLTSYKVVGPYEGKWRIDLSESSISFSVNGVLQFTQKDATYRSGFIGFWVYTTPTQRMVIDNLEVESVPPFKVELEQNLRRCVSVMVSNDQPIQGGEIGIAFDPALVTPIAVKPGADFPAGADLHFDLQPPVNCSPKEGVKAGLTAVWLSSQEDRGTLPAGTHEVLRICFETAAGKPAETCSPLSFVTCLGLLEAPLRNIVTDAAGKSQTLGTRNNQVCVQSESPFIRGDANGDGHFDISDPIGILGFLFRGDFSSSCQDAMDADDNGHIDITDAIYLLGWRFSGGTTPNGPFPVCGADPSPDQLDDCESFLSCD